MNSLFLRALLAVVLLIGFYLLALAIAGGLLAIPIVGFMSHSRIPIKLVVVCGLVGLSILWAILPRFDRFTPEGPRLLPAKHPRLFRELEYIALQAGQPMPHEVYLVSDVNAWVANRGGIMGFGSRPIMGIGLGLMQTLTVDELRAVIAHEFGHYCGSDTKLGPWVYKTRAAIGRTLGALDDSLFRLPFEWYGKMFLRLTSKVSRHQEFLADQVSARVAGARHVAACLTKTHGAAVAFQVYMENEVVPVLGAGFRPPLAAGFAGFMQTSAIRDQIGKLTEKEIKEGKADPYDSHPTLPERLAAIKAPQGSDSNSAPAISLLDDLPNVERELLATIMVRDGSKLKAIDWHETFEQVYAPMWRKQVEKNKVALTGKAPSQIPQLLADVKGFCKSLRTTDGLQAPQSHAQAFASSILGAAFGLALIRQGWMAFSLPGESIYFERDGKVFKLFDDLSDVSKKTKSSELWLAQLNELRIPDESMIQSQV